MLLGLAAAAKAEARRKGLKGGKAGRKKRLKTRESDAVETGAKGCGRCVGVLDSAASSRRVGGEGYRTASAAGRRTRLLPCVSLCVGLPDGTGRRTKDEANAIGQQRREKAARTEQGGGHGFGRSRDQRDHDG